MTRPPVDARADGGFATVWAAGAVAVLALLLGIGLALGSAVTARHRAAAAADLAALAAAGRSVHGQGPACERAGRVAAGSGGRIASCRLDGWDALVEVHVPVRLPLLGQVSATARARAGPADPPAGPGTVQDGLFSTVPGPGSPDALPGPPDPEPD